MCTPSKCCKKKNVCYCEHCKAYRESQLTVAKNKSKTIICSDILSIYVPTCAEIREIEEESDYGSDNYVPDTDAEDTDCCSQRFKDTKEQDEDAGKRLKSDGKRSNTDVSSNKRTNGEPKHSSKTDVYSEPTRSEMDMAAEDRRYSARKLEPTDVYEIYGSPNKKNPQRDNDSNSNRTKYGNKRDDDYLHNSDSKSNINKSDLRDYEKRNEECRKYCDEEITKRECFSHHRINYNGRKRYKKDTNSGYSCDLEDDSSYQGVSRMNDNTCRCRKCYEESKQMGPSKVSPQKSKTTIWSKISTTFFKDDSCKKWCPQDKCVCGKLHTIKEHHRELPKHNNKHYYKSHGEEETDDDTDVETSNSKHVPKNNVPQRAVQSLRDTPQVCQCCGCHQGTGYSTFRSMVFPYKSLQLKRMKFCDILKKVIGARNDKSEINLCQKCCSQYRAHYK